MHVTDRSEIFNEPVNSSRYASKVNDLNMPQTLEY